MDSKELMRDVVVYAALLISWPLAMQAFGNSVPITAVVVFVVFEVAKMATEKYIK